MPKKHFFILIICIINLLLINVSFSNELTYYELSYITQPTNQPAHAIGYYSNGCLVGAKTLPKQGDGFQVMRLSRKRYYVHPELYDFLMYFSQEIKNNHSFKGILIGDTSGAIGGALPTGHTSHQIGLDADIWLMPAPSYTLSDMERETLPAISHVTIKQAIRDSWTKDHSNFVIMAAHNNKVARIFVNPAIKKQICADVNWQKNINALSKIRPWYGHDAHMHIRLKCPMNNADCINQNPPMLNHGCTGNDIDWWFTQEAISYYNKKPSEQAKRFNDIPEKCQKLYLRIKQGFLKNYQSSD